MKNCMLSGVLVFALTAGAGGTEVFEARKFGAYGDGVRDDTAALQRTIDFASEAGGGVVEVARGTYRIGSVWMRSRVRLHLLSGACLKGSREESAYGGGDDSVLDGRAMILMEGVHDVSVVGEEGACIDGSNSASTRRFECRGAHVFKVFGSTNLVFRGYRVVDAGNYAHWLRKCSDVSFEKILVEGGHDGVHCWNSRRVQISDCDFSTGDDCVAGVDYHDLKIERCRMNTPCQCLRLGGRRILIEDCDLSGPGKHPHRCTLPREDVLEGREPDGAGRRYNLAAFLYFCQDEANEREDSGEILMRNCRVRNVQRFFHCNMDGSEVWARGRPLRDIHFENVSVSNVEYPLLAISTAECPTEMSFTNCSFSFSRDQSEFIRAENFGKISLKDVNVEGVRGPLVRSWGRQLDVEAVNVTGATGVAHCSSGEKVDKYPILGFLEDYPEHEMSPKNWKTREVRYTAADSGKVVSGKTFSGAIPLGKWIDAGNGVWECRAPRVEQLWVNGERAPNAYWPKKDYFYFGDLVSCTKIAEKTWREWVAFTNAAVREKLVLLDREDMSNTVLTVRNSWCYERRYLESYDVVSNAVVTLNHEGEWPHWKTWHNSRGCLARFENVRSAFTEPGEWFYDGVAGRLCYRPRPGETIENTVFAAPHKDATTLMKIAGTPARSVEGLLFTNCTFEISAMVDMDGKGDGRTCYYALQAAMHAPGAVEMKYARNCRFENCIFRHTGGYGLRMRDGCFSNAVVNCTFEDLGAGGIWVGRDSPNPEYTVVDDAFKNRMGYMVGNRTEEVFDYSQDAVAFITVANTVVRHGGQMNPEGIGICFGHVSDSKITHCEIYDMYYSGVSLGWVWGYWGSVAQRNEVAFTKIYDLGKGVMADMGGVYTLGASHGTTIHDCVIHDVHSYSYGGWAMYNDEGSEGIKWYNNLCYDCSDAIYFMHYGRNNVVRNCILAFGRDRQIGVGYRENHFSLLFERNIVIFDPPSKVFFDHDSVGSFLNRADAYYVGNLWWRTDGKPLFNLNYGYERWRDTCHCDIEGMACDPLFYDAANRDFRLKPTSPAFACGFKEFDFSKAGVCQEICGDRPSRGPVK